MSSRGSASADSRWAPRIATIRGIPIRVHISFGLVMLFLLWRTGSASGLRVAALEQVFIVAVFACVALHELAHAVTALRHGLPISGITLYPFGGVARMGRRPPSGRLEVTIAAAGPIANLLIAAAILAVTAGRVLAPGDSLALRMLGMLFWANLILAGFNLLPAFPLDGGRVFRGLLTTRMGWARATVWAASVGQVVGAVLIVVGLVHNLWLALGGLLILPAANAELRYALALRHFADRRVGDVARTALVRLAPGTTLSEAAELSVANPLADFLVVEDGRAVAYLAAARLWSSVRSDRAGTGLAAELAEPLGAAVPAGAAVEEAAERVGAAAAGVAPVVDENGEVVGVVSAGDLQRAAQLARHAVSR
jgi:Zn-dependent protease